MRLNRIITVITIVIIWSKRHSFSFALSTVYADIVIITPNETNKGLRVALHLEASRIV